MSSSKTNTLEAAELFRLSLCLALDYIEISTSVYMLNNQDFFFQENFKEIIQNKIVLVLFCLSICFSFLLLGMLTTTVISFFLDDTPSSRQFVKKKSFFEKNSVSFCLSPYLYISVYVFIFYIYRFTVEKIVVHKSNREYIYCFIFSMCVELRVFVLMLLLLLHHFLRSSSFSE